MAQVKDITAFLDSFAPPIYQESYDNAGLVTGDLNDEITGILITLDVTESIIDEAVTNNCNLIISHHPILFKPIKKLTGSNYVERIIIKAIKNNIAIYSSHTNLDNVKNGVSYKMAERLGLQNIKTLAPTKSTLQKLTFFVPVENTETVLQAIHVAGAGNIGNYEDCSFRVEGTGTFMPNQIAKPHIGQVGKLEYVKENRVEVIFTKDKETAVLAELFKSHPYEEVSYFLSGIDNVNFEIGAGITGELEHEMMTERFLEKIKVIFKVKMLRHTTVIAPTVKRIALSGGAGSFLLAKAIQEGADVFLTADFKYHEFFDAESKILITDIGHYESEQFTKELFLEIISKKFTNIAVLLSKINTNPVHYL